MIQHMDLGFVDPKREQEVADIPPSHTDVDLPPWETGEDLPVLDMGGGNMIGDAVRISETNEDLEVYQKAEGFKKLQLISGNSVSDDIVEYILQNYGVAGRQRLALTKHVMSVLGYRASPDVMLMLSCTKRARVVIATAGAGKTTSLQVEILVDKMLDKALGTGELKPEVVEGTTVYLPRILYLNYNKHNVKPIEDKHTAVCNALNKTLNDSDAVDDSIESSTVHAFCHKWLTAFAGEVDLPPMEIITDSNKATVWTAIITPRWTKFYGDSNANVVEYTELDELYNYKVESMLDWDEFFKTAKFLDSGLKDDFVKACIKKYDAMKRQMKLMDFTDYLVLMIEVLRNNPNLKQKLQERYRLIIADENQDFTRLMNELLLELYNPAINRMVVVGDPDQTLYEFKGVSPDNVVHLMDRLEDSQLLGLDTNYRCPDGIVAGAKKILDMNVLRFDKPINTVRTGGCIVTHPISYGEDQSTSVIQLLKQLGAQEWPNTVLSYRNNQSALIILEELYYAGIPFRVLDGRRPFSNSVFWHIDTAIKALKEKDSFELNKTLFRFLPLSREVWENILETNRRQRHYHIHDVVADWKALPNGTVQALNTLFSISNIVDTAPVCDYIAPLTKLYRLYYFDFMLRSANPRAPEQSIDMVHFDRTVKFFNRSMTWDHMRREMNERNVDNMAGVTVSTFHGLKGLEFNYVLAIDFSETVFPNFSGIEMKYPPNTAVAAKEAENRLCYVLVTRAIKELHLFYPKGDPSLYVSILTKDGAITKDAGDIEDLALGSVTSPSGILTSKLDFIKRLTQDRRR